MMLGSNMKQADETWACAILFISIDVAGAREGGGGRQYLLPSPCDSSHFAQSVSIWTSLVIVTHDDPLIQSRSSLCVCTPQPAMSSSSSLKFCEHLSQGGFLFLLSPFHLLVGRLGEQDALLVRLDALLVRLDDL